jgi:glycosyltransferase involved in cell wall biosynthesis/ADP-heptose:LPS heptosyltransferase
MREAFLAGLQPDVVLVSSLFEGFTDDALTSIELLRTGIPTAVILYDLIPLLHSTAELISNEAYKAWYERKLDFLRKANLLLAISASSAQDALRARIASASSIANILGAHDPLFQPTEISPTQRHSLRMHLGIGDRFVLYVGGADESKNLQRLIEAYALLPQRVRQGMQLVLVGQMPEARVQTMRHTARMCGLAELELVLTGQIADRELLTLYNTCSLFVFPSLYEGFGLPPLEAMACGAAVIASNSTSIPEVIGDSDALFDPTSSKQIASKMLRALTDLDFRSALIDRGKRRSQEFSWENSARKAMAAMKSLLVPDTKRISPNLVVEKTAIFKPRSTRILILKVDHLGDFILSIPALAKLRARYPHASIDIVVGSWNVPVASSLGYFDRVYAYDYFRSKSSVRPSVREQDLGALLAQLGDYDIALDLRRQPEARFLIARVHALRKYAFACFDADVNRCLDVALPVYPESAFVATPLNKTSISLQMMRVVDSIPSDPNDFVSLPTLGRVGERVEGAVAIFPKAGSSIREWDQARFRGLIERLNRDLRVSEVNVYLANAAEASEFPIEACEKVKQHVGLSFDKLVESLSRNAVCVANNSGGAHLASYLGLTVLSIYSGHETSAEWGPQFYNATVLHRAAECAPCHGGSREDCPNELFCLSDISVDDVYFKTLESLSVGTANRTAQFGGAKPGILPQVNSDFIVRQLIASLARLDDGTSFNPGDISLAIAKNHPDFSMTPDLRSFSLNVAYDHRTARIEWRGFSTIEKRFRWTDGSSASMTFECPNHAPSRGVLALSAATFGRQHIIIDLNGVVLVDAVEDTRRLKLKIPFENLKVGVNRLGFQLPDARSPNSDDPRKLAVAIKSFEVRVQDD